MSSDCLNMSASSSKSHPLPRVNGGGGVVDDVVVAAVVVDGLDVVEGVEGRGGTRVTEIACHSNAFYTQILQQQSTFWLNRNGPARNIVPIL